MPTSSRQNMLFYENLRRIRNFYWVDVGIDPYKCGLLEVRPFLLRSLYRLRKRNEPSKKGQRLEAQARQRYKIVPAVFSSISFLPRQKRYGPRSGGCGFANCTAPPAHSNCTSGGIPRHPAQKNSPSRGFFYAQSYPHVDVDCLQIFCSQLRNRCFTKLPVDRSDLRAHLPVDK